MAHGGKPFGNRMLEHTAVTRTHRSSHKKSTGRLERRIRYQKPMAVKTPVPPKIESVPVT
jgi:hypothetical protein